MADVSGLCDVRRQRIGAEFYLGPTSGMRQQLVADVLWQGLL